MCCAIAHAYLFVKFHSAQSLLTCLFICCVGNYDRSEKQSTQTLCLCGRNPEYGGERNFTIANQSQNSFTEITNAKRNAFIYLYIHLFTVFVN